MPRLPLSEYASVTLDGSGNGTARIGPTGSGEVWYPTVVAIRVDSAISSAQCRIYAGSSPTDQNLVDGTYTGGLNSTDSIAGQVIRLGQRVFAVWTGGDAGAQATVTVTGTKDVP